MKKLFLLSALLLLFGPSSWAVTYYVSNTAANGYTVGFDSHTTVEAQAKTKPWLTLNGAITKATTGDIIIINDGTYSETSGAGYLNISKAMEFRAENTGMVVVNAASGASYGVRITLAASTTTLTGLIIDGTFNKTYGLYTSSCYGLIMNNTRIRNFTSTGFSNDATTYYMDIRNSVITSTVATVAGYYSTTFTSGSFIVDGLLIDISTTTNAAGGGIILVAQSSTGTLASISNSTVTVYSTNAGSLMSIRNINNLVLSGNVLTANGPTTRTGIQVYATLAIHSANNPIIRYNTVNHNGTGGISIVHGTDGATVGDNKHNDGAIYGNVVIGSTNSTTLHGIMIGSNRGGFVWGNRSSLCNLPFLAKLNNSGIFFGNEARNITGTGHGLRSKGSTNTSFISNGIYLQDGDEVGMYNDHDTIIPTYSGGILYSANNIYSDVASSNFVNIAAGSTATFYNNNYYTTQALASDQWTYQGTNYATLAAWQSARENTATSNSIISTKSYKKTTPTYGTWDSRGSWQSIRNGNSLDWPAKDW